MNTNCPNCGKTIDLVGASDLKDEFELSPNTVQHARDKGKFPEPWLSFGNRNIWLRSVVENYIKDRNTKQLESTVAELMKALDELPVQERKAVIERVEQLKT
jgi:hypothetical protein